MTGCGFRPLGTGCSCLTRPTPRRVKRTRKDRRLGRIKARQKEKARGPEKVSRPQRASHLKEKAKRAKRAKARVASARIALVSTKDDAEHKPGAKVTTIGDDRTTVTETVVMTRLPPTEKPETFPVRETTGRTEETTTSPVKTTMTTKAIMRDGQKVKP